MYIQQHSILPWQSPTERRTVVETVEYDGQGRVVKRTTTTTSGAPSVNPYVTYSSASHTHALGHSHSLWGGVVNAR